MGKKPEFKQLNLVAKTIKHIEVILALSGYFNHP